ncbi:MAG: amino acid permease [Candidatus Aenigmarchaeota archaeon]|nr:amino acid permease [Candidatus Aenigmarchaeota archaeon]
MAEEVKLRRALGMWEATLCGIGIIFGAGIYALVGKAAGLGGNAVWISFGISALLAAFTGLSYAELSSLFPKAGAEYVYSLKAFGRRIAFMTGWLILISGVFSAATVSLGFAGYFAALFGSPVTLTAFVLIILMGLILLYGIKQSAWVGILFTLIESAGLVLIILIGLPYLGSVNYLQMSAEGLNGIIAAAALIFFAFIGFEEITRLSEETKNPTRNVPRALIIAIIISTVIYMLVAISAVSILGYDALGHSKAPMADVADKALGPGAHTLLSVIALFATSNTVLLILLATSRMLYGMASAGSLPKKIGWVHPRRRTPWLAIMIICAVSVALLAFRDISFVAGVTDFAVFLTFVIINFSLIKLRYSPSFRLIPKAGFRVPLSIGRMPVLPLLGAALSLVMIYWLGADIIIIGIVAALAGLVVNLMIREAKFEERLVPVHAIQRAAASARRKAHKIGLVLMHKKS